MENQEVLKDKVIFVTGSARGIGLATILLLHRRGAKVIMHARHLDSLTDRKDIPTDANIKFVTGDFSSMSNVRAVWQNALQAYGHIDVVVNNAGAWLPSHINSDEEWDEGWENNLTINLAAPSELCRQALLHFQNRSGGIIINITSRSAHRGDDADHLAYGAAKGGLLALTKGIARGYGKNNILAYAIAPGWVSTDLSDGAIPESILDNLPLGEVTPAKDVAEVVAFLSTGLSRHTTGATIDITGADYVR